MIRPLYVALGVNPEGTTLMLAPNGPSAPMPFQFFVSDLADLGLYESAALVGLVVMEILCAFHHDLKTRYHPPPEHPVLSPPHRPLFPRVPMREMRIGIGVVDVGDETDLLLKTCTGDEALREGGGTVWHLAELVKLAPKAASEHVGLVALFGISAWHLEAFEPYRGRLF